MALKSFGYQRAKSENKESSEMSPAAVKNQAVGSHEIHEWLFDEKRWRREQRFVVLGTGLSMVFHGTPMTYQGVYTVPRYHVLSVPLGTPRSMRHLTEFPR